MRAVGSWTEWRWYFMKPVAKRTHKLWLEWLTSSGLALKPTRLIIASVLFGLSFEFLETTCFPPQWNKCEFRMRIRADQLIWRRTGHMAQISSAVGELGDDEYKLLRKLNKFKENLMERILEQIELNGSDGE